MKKSSSSSKLYSPSRKHRGGNLVGNGLSAAAAACGGICGRQWRGVLLAIAVLGMIYWGTNGRRANGSMQRSSSGAKRMYTSSGREVVLLNLDDVKASTCAKHSALMNFTTKEYQEYFLLDPGKERYCLLTHLAYLFHDEHGSFVDIGTRVAASALSLMSHGHRVTTVDLPTSMDLENMVHATFGKTLNEWKQYVNHAAGSDLLTIVKADVLSSSQNSTNVWSTLQAASLIYIDTLHKPDSKPFERQFLKKLEESRYKGIVIIDDIYLNHEMQKWFDELVCAIDAPYKVYDITVAGHSSGTGLLDFERNRQEQTDRGSTRKLMRGGSVVGRVEGYSLVVGTGSEKLAEKAKKYSFLKGGGQLQRFRQTESEHIPYQFLPLVCEGL